MRRLVLLAAVGLICAWASPAQARGQYQRLPLLEGKGGTLRIQFQKYANGKVYVKVKNVGRRSAGFKADGLFFVPKGDPERAPQRMGAAGPFEIYEKGVWKPSRRLNIRAGRTVRLKLQTFCLDSHRASPGNGQAFRVAKKRLPRKLRAEIVRGSKRILRRPRPSARAKGAAQSYIWKTRNRKWIKLEGERRMEKSPRRRYRRHRYPRRYRRLRRPQRRLSR